MSKWTGPKRADELHADDREDNYSPTSTPTSTQRSLPVTTADLKALNDRVTELRRKMPDDEPYTILARLHENGEFLWADEAHVEGSLARLEEQTEMVLRGSPFGDNGRFTTDEVNLIYGLVVDKLHQLNEKIGDDVRYVGYPQLHELRRMAEGELKARGEWEG